ncbi:hypothetical protein [Rosistilla oblonga]|uniref:hypothetical protein n=1 Tax=Rosistilla oblonga TaxID=2527990 RepID=UPI003A976DD4
MHRFNSMPFQRRKVNRTVARRQLPPRVVATASDFDPQPQMDEIDAKLERLDKMIDALRKAYAGRDDELANLGTPGSPQMKSDLDITYVEPVAEIGRPRNIEPYLYDNIERTWLRHRFPSVTTNLQELGAALLAYRMNPASPKPVKRFEQLGVAQYEIGALDAEVAFGEMLDFTLKCEGEAVQVSAQNDAILDQIAIIGAIEV